MSDGTVKVDSSELLDAYVSIVEARHLCDDRCVDSEVVKLIDEVMIGLQRMQDTVLQQLTEHD
jgi:hypothetical protein